MAHVQIPDQDARHDYVVGATAQDAFEVKFPFFAHSDLVVFVGTTRAVLRSQPVLATEYTVEAVREDGGYPSGVVRLGAAVADTAVTIWRDVPVERREDFPYPSNSLNIRALNSTLDRTIALLQDQRLRSRRTLRLRDTDPSTELLLPDRGARRGRVLGFSGDDGAEPIAFSPEDLMGGLVLPVPVSQGGTGATSPAAARAALGIGSVPFILADEIGLAAAFPTDDTKRLNDAMAAASAAGGGVFYLRSKTQSPFYFSSAVRVPSFVHLLFGSPVRLGARGCLRIAGTTARTGPTCVLAANSVAGATFVTIDPAGSGIAGPLSGVFAVGDLVSLTGRRDHAGEPLESQTLRVTSVTDGNNRLGVAPDLAFDYQATYAAGAYEAAFGQPNRTQVRLIVSAPLAANNVVKSDVVQLAPGHVQKFDVGDWIAVEDEKTAGDVAGTSTNRIHYEQAQIVAINAGGADTLTLSRRLLHAFDVGYAARVVKLDPAINASIGGASIEFVETPPADVVTHTFEITHAVDSTIDDCSVPNTDVFGSRGNAFRIRSSIACGINRPVVRNPAFLGAGEGYGVTLYYATDCWVDDPYVAGGRHSVLFQGATCCVVSGLQAIDTRLSAVDFHGCEEIGNVVEAEVLEGGSRTASSTRVACRFGNGTHYAGAHDNVVHARRVSGFSGVNGICVDFVPPSTGNVFKGDRVDDVYHLVWLGDVAGYPSLVAARNSIEDTVVENAGWHAIDADGGRSTSTARAHVDFRLRRVELRRGVRMIRLRRMAGVEIEDVTIEASGQSSTHAWGIDAEDVTGLRVYGGRIRRTRKGIRIKNCPAARVHRTLIEDLVGSTVVLTDEGGCDGYVWGLVDWIGFAATRETLNGGSTGTEYPTVGGAFVVT